MIPAFLLVLSVVVYRVTTGLLIHSGAGWLSNFAPMAAIALCSAAYFPRKYKFTVPFGALLLSDIALNLYYRVSFFDVAVLCHYLAFAIVGLLGLAISRRASIKTVLPAT